MTALKDFLQAAKLIFFPWGIFHERVDDTPMVFFPRSSMMRGQSRHAIKVTLHGTKNHGSRETKSRAGPIPKFQDLRAANPMNEICTFVQGI